MPRDRLSFPASPPTPRISPEKAAYLSAQQNQLSQQTLRSLTGSELYSISPPSSPLEKRYSRQKISLFRSAAGEERALPQSPSSPHNSAIGSQDDDDQLDLKPRISSVTDSAHTGSPDHTRADVPLKMDLSGMRYDLSSMEVAGTEVCADDDNDDTNSTYSHASAINLDDLENEDLAGLQSHNHGDVEAPPIINRQVLETQRQSFANSFARARKVRESRKAVVLARPELQPYNKSANLIGRCVDAFTEALDMNLVFARTASERFNAFSSLFTKEERVVISDLLRDASARLRNEAPTPWRSPIQRSTNRILIAGSPHSEPPYESGSKLSHVLRGQWSRRSPKALTNDTLVRSVVFGSHVIPGVQSADSILLRMAAEYQREEVNRKASRAERIDIPLSFAMTLTGALATFARLDCSASYRRYRSRSAANRRSNPQAMIILKTRYDGIKLNFAVTLHGEAPCTVLFRRPRIFSPRKIDNYATLVTEAKDILTEFGREVAGPRE